MNLIYFKFIFKRLLLLFSCIFLFLTSSYFCLELLTFSSFPPVKRLFFHFLSLILFKADFFINLSFLLATTYTLQTLKQQGELIALQTAGISKFRLSAPFYTLAAILLLFSYWNTEAGIAKAVSWKIQSTRKNKRFKKEPIVVKTLENGQKIIYQIENSAVFDLYWIISEKEIIHCKSVSETNHLLTGHFADKLEMNPLGRFEKANSFQSLPLPFVLDDLKERFVPPEKCSLSTIYSILTTESLTLSTDYAKYLSSFVYKLIHPWFPFIFATGLLAFIIPSQRKTTYLSFVIGIFSFLLFYSIIKTFMILSENYLVSPWLSVFLIPIAIQGGFTYRLCKK